MLIDTREQNDEQTTKNGFNPNVVNREIPVQSRGKATFWLLFFLSWLTVVAGIIITVWYVGKKNWFNAKQMKINETASGIDIQLTKRRDTLVKLVDATKSSMKFEKSLLTDITSLRNVDHFDAKNRIQTDAKISSTFGKLVATMENYPKLKSTETIAELMLIADYIEREIAASRRLYNATATEFNQVIYTWPSCVPAAKMRLHNFPLFVASSQQKTDVSLDLGNN